MSLSAEFQQLLLIGVRDDVSLDSLVEKDAVLRDRVKRCAGDLRMQFPHNRINVTVERDDDGKSVRFGIEAETPMLRGRVGSAASMLSPYQARTTNGNRIIIQWEG